MVPDAQRRAAAGDLDVGQADREEQGDRLHRAGSAQGGGGEEFGSGAGEQPRARVDPPEARRHDAVPRQAVSVAAVTSRSMGVSPMFLLVFKERGHGWDAHATKAFQRFFSTNRISPTSMYCPPVVCYIGRAS